MASTFKLLYVDDELDNLNVFKASFRSEFDIQTFGSAIEALKSIQKEHYHIILADQRMPEMTGVELLEKVNEISPDSIRILLTGYSDTQALADAINKGKVFYYSSKPWKREELKMVLIKAIDHYVLIRRNKDLIKKLSVTINELEVFLYRASHDLRAPITTQLGLLNLLKLEVSESAKNYIAKIEEMIQKLEHTLEKMSQLSLKGYDFVKDTHQMDLTPLLDEFVAEHSELILKENISIENSLSKGSNFYFERETTKAILENILENSVQFRRPGVPAKIKISNSFTEGEKEMKIEIEDNGMGIGDSHLPNVFHPFYRATAASKGNGLGLYIVKKICDTLEADLTITSDGSSWTKVEIVMLNLRDRFKS
jgi:signal transduction histidine kinase